MSIIDKKYIVVKNIIPKDLVKVYFDYLKTKKEVCENVLKNGYLKFPRYLD